jgi:hypothetical protein
MGIAACSADNAPGENGMTYLRIVNSTFQATDAADTAFVPIAIDVIVDSSDGVPSVMALAPNSVADGPTGPGGNAAKYFATASGIRSFIARRSGLDPLGPSFYTTSGSADCTPSPYLPKQQLMSQIYYTMIVGGLNPAPKLVSGNSINILAPAGKVVNGACNLTTPAFPLTSLRTVDDPFSPPRLAVGGDTVYQARFHVWNAAPFTSFANGTGDGFATFVTDGTPETGPTVTQLQSIQPVGGYALYLSQSEYIDVTAKPYWLTIVDLYGFGNIVYQAKINYQPGEVHSLIVQNTLPAGRITFPITDLPPTSYIKVTDIIDNKF